MNKLKFLKSKRSIIIAVTLVIFSFLFVSFNDTDDFELAKNMDIYHTLMRELRLYYVDDIEISKTFKTSIDQMLATLDPYTVYYPESEIEDYKFMTTGQYGGIGALIRTDKDKIVIEEVYENYPAEKAGIKAGDIIKKIGDHEAKTSNYDDVSILMKGLPDTEIEITVLRPTDNKTYTKKLIRERIKVDNVTYFGMLNVNTGYIYLSGFTQNAYTEVREALINLKSKNAKKIVLDLRSNPGGLLIESVNIVSLFVEKGTKIVSMKGKMKESNQTFLTTMDPVDTQIPVCVLVNRNSASASEIVSGALQDLDRAVIIGERTYGKGLVQNTRDLVYNAKLKVTTAKYYIPSGRCIQALDYTHRNPDGSVGYIPDSLISEFKTKIGRKVYDGGGVTPEIKVDETTSSHIAQYLINNFIIFDFATVFASMHDTIGLATNFRIGDEEYQKFIEFALSKKIEYKSDTQKALEELIEIAKKEKYSKKAEPEIEALKKAIKLDVREDLLYFKEEVKTLLEYEIVKRYYYKKGYIMKSLDESSCVKMAKNVLDDTNRYNSLLKP